MPEPIFAICTAGLWAVVTGNFTLGDMLLLREVCRGFHSSLEHPTLWEAAAKRRWGQHCKVVNFAACMKYLRWAHLREQMKGVEESTPIFPELASCAHKARAFTAPILNGSARFSNRLVLLAGVAGAGKTTLLRAVRHCLSESASAFAFRRVNTIEAPSCKAIQRAYADARSLAPSIIALDDDIGLFQDLGKPLQQPGVCGTSASEAAAVQAFILEKLREPCAPAEQVVVVLSVNYENLDPRALAVAEKRLFLAPPTAAEVGQWVSGPFQQQVDEQTLAVLGGLPWSDVICVLRERAVAQLMNKPKQGAPPHRRPEFADACERGFDIL